MPASSNTISRWVKLFLSESGVDTGQYAAGRVRSAAATKADVSGAPIDVILQSAGWAQESTFRWFYKKPVAKQAFDQFVLPTA